MNPLVLIPARFQSSRFPGKPLELISGKSLIQRVYEGVQSEKWESAVITDHEEIEKHVLSFGGKVLRVDEETKSGTERIYLGYKKNYQPDQFDFVVNVQGDEPLINSKLIESLLSFHASTDFDITTMYKRRSDNQISDENIVKIAMSENGHCLYFSRAPIPYGSNSWKQHVGIYSYKVNSLKKYIETPSSSLEEIERLEQLKALEFGMSIGAIETKDDLIGVDRPEDIKLVEEYLLKKGIS